MIVSSRGFHNACAFFEGNTINCVGMEWKEVEISTIRLSSLLAHFTPFFIMMHFCMMQNKERRSITHPNLNDPYTQKQHAG